MSPSSSRKSNSISSLNNPSLGAHARLPTNDVYEDLNDHVPLTAIPASPTPSPSRSASDVSTIVGVEPMQPVVEHLEDDPFNPLEVRSGVVVSPFADPPPLASQAFDDPAGGQTSALLVPLTPKSGSFGGEGVTTTRQPPPALPLGLPPPVTPPPPIPIDSPTVPSPPPQQQRRGQQGEDEEEGKTRWWHEWLCGCGEGKDRGGDHQAGRTNPFE